MRNRLETQLQLPFWINRLGEIAKKPHTRRVFIGTAIGLFMSTQLSGDSLNNAANKLLRLPEPLTLLHKPLTPDSATELALSLVQAESAIAPRAALLRTVTDAQNFEQAILPLLVRDGVHNRENLVSPTVETYDDAKLNKYSTLDFGDVGCLDPYHPPLEINKGFFSSTSPLHQGLQPFLVPAVLAHELIHENSGSNQGNLTICTDLADIKNRSNIETATQVDALNLLASATLQGNRYAYPGFLSLFQYFAEGYLLADCITKNDFTPYYAYLQQLPNPAIPIEQFDLYRDFYRKESSQEQMLANVQAYQVRPLRIVRNAVLSSNHLTVPIPVLSAGNQRVQLTDTATVMAHTKTLTQAYTSSRR